MRHRTRAWCGVTLRGTSRQQKCLPKWKEVLWTLKNRRTVVVASENMYHTYSYVEHKLAIFNTILFTLLHLLLTRWWDMGLKHDVGWLWEEQADSRNVCQNEKKYCSCCITLIRIDTILSKNIYRVWLPSRVTKQTYFGCPKPSGKY